MYSICSKKLGNKPRKRGNVKHFDFHLTRASKAVSPVASELETPNKNGHPGTIVEPITKIYMGGSINGGTPNGWFIRENRIKMDDLGEPPVQETSVYILLSHVESTCFWPIKWCHLPSDLSSLARSGGGTANCRGLGCESPSFWGNRIAMSESTKRP